MKAVQTRTIVCLASLDLAEFSSSAAPANKRSERYMLLSIAKFSAISHDAHVHAVPIPTTAIKISRRQCSHNSG